MQLVHGPKGGRARPAVETFTASLHQVHGVDIDDEIAARDAQRFGLRQASAQRAGEGLPLLCLSKDGSGRCA